MEVIEKIHEDFAIEKDRDIEIVEKIARFYWNQVLRYA